MSEPRFLGGETIRKEDLQAKLQQLGAQARPDRSSSTMHVYYLPSRGQWLGVQLKHGFLKLGYFSDCPCAGGEIP